MKKPEESKKGLECALCDEPADICGEGCPCWSAYSPAEMRQDEHVSDALAYIQQLEARVPRWIPVEKRKPAKGETVLVAFADGYVTIGTLWGECWSIPYSEFEQPVTKGTWWMPMPEPPEEERRC